MPTWLAIVLGAFVALVIILAIGGIYGRRRQLAATQDRFSANLEQVNRDLATAAAQDRGWDRSTLEDAARRIYSSERGSEPADLVLIEVLDRPGTDQDQAVFRVGSAERLILGRRDGQWVRESLE